MAQIHSKFTGELVKVLLASYENEHLSREEIEKTLGVGKTRFFASLKTYKEDPERFSIQYQRTSKKRVRAETEEKIKTELLRDKTLIDDKDLPISGYNYAALNDRLKKRASKGPHQPFTMPGRIESTAKGSISTKH